MAAIDAKINAMEAERVKSEHAYNASFGNGSLRFQSKGEMKTYAECIGMLRALKAEVAEIFNDAELDWKFDNF